MEDAGVWKRLLIVVAFIPIGESLSHVFQSVGFLHIFFRIYDIFMMLILKYLILYRTKIRSSVNFILTMVIAGIYAYNL